MKRPALERLHAVDLCKFRLRQRAIRADNETRLHVIAAISDEMPHLLRFVPCCGRYRGLKHRQLIEVVALCDGLAVSEDFAAFCIAILGHVVHLIEQWQIVVGRHIAGDAGIAVPIPGAAHVTAALHNADALNAHFAQTRRCEQRGEPTTDEQTFHRVVNRFARCDGASVRVALIAPQFAR